MTAADWRIHATEANQQKFGDAQARLDEGDYPAGPAGNRQRVEDERFADWYDQAVNQCAQDEFERQGEADEFNRHWPEPPDGARIEWEADDGRLHAACRHDIPEHEGGSWWEYGRDDRYTWPRLVAEYRFPDGLDDIAVLVDAHAACEALDAIISDYPGIPTGAAAGVAGDFHAWTMNPGWPTAEEAQR